MATLPTNFQFHTKTVRVVEIDGDPWFVAADVCKALDIANMSDGISNLDSTDVSHARLTPTGRARPNKIVSEGGLYELVFQSRKPAAREFTRWVAGTVIPSIRKDGMYVSGEEKVATGEMSEEEMELLVYERLKAKVARVKAKNEGQRDQDTILEASTLY